MADKISRRSFLKGTGKTILTAGALSSGIGLSTSTTPTTVIPKVLKGFNPGLAPVTPRARAYRSFLKGIRAVSVSTPPLLRYGLRRKIGNIITKKRLTPQDYLPAKSTGRLAFESATKKPRAKAWSEETGRRLTNKQLRTGIGNYNQLKVAKQIAPDPQSKVPPSQRTKEIWRGNERGIASDLTKSARKELARELREQRKLTQTLRKKGIKAMVKESSKIKGAKVGGGGKMALPGLESAKNPTGMSLITQRYTL